MRIFVPGDAAAVAVGADAVATAIQEAARGRGISVQIVRNGSRGMVWLEPLVEVETPAGRIAYGPVDREDVTGLFEAGFLEGADHPLRIGRPEDHPFLKRQTRLAFARCGITDPLSLDDYRAYGGFKGLERAIAIGPAATVEEVIASGLRGAAARVSRPASNGAPLRKPGPSRNTSSATRTRAIAAPSPTG